MENSGATSGSNAPASPTDRWVTITRAFVQHLNKAEANKSLAAEHFPFETDAFVGAEELPTIHHDACNCIGETSSEGDIPECRLCLGSDNPDQLFMPCHCKGSSAFVHRSCLQKWRLASVNPRSYYRCDQCKAEYDIRRTILADLLRSDWLRNMLAFMFLGYAVTFVAYVVPCADWFPEIWFGIQLWVWFRTFLWSAMVVGIILFIVTIIAAIASHDFAFLGLYIREGMENFRNDYPATILTFVGIVITEVYTQSSLAQILVWLITSFGVPYLPVKLQIVLSTPASILCAYLQYRWRIITWSSVLFMVAFNIGIDGFDFGIDTIVRQTQSLCRNLLYWLELRVLHTVRDIREEPTPERAPYKEKRNRRVMMFVIAGVILLLLVVLPVCMAYVIATAPMFSLTPQIQEVNPTQLIDIDSQRGEELVTALWFLRHDKENKAFSAEYAKFAADMEGLVRPLAINCDKWDTFCTGLHVHRTPVVFMKVSGTNLSPKRLYLGRRKTATLSKEVNKLILGGIVELFDGKWSIDNFFTLGKSMVKAVYSSGLNVSKFPVSISLIAEAQHTLYDGELKFPAIKSW